MTGVATHPDRLQLADFGLGKLDSETASQIEEHLGSCRTCCDTLLHLQDDTFTSLVRKAKPPLHSDDTDGCPHQRPRPEDATVLVPTDASAAVADLPPELSSHPRYEVLELLGQGGMGHVYRARHKLMNRSVALKVISAHLVQNRQAVERFRREVQAAAHLVHRNIVTAYDAEQAGDVHFLVMEFVEGADLATVVQQRGPMSIAEACDCIRQAARGLQHAHEKGMVHRDIKPHNLMMSPDGQVRILDFGLANFATEAAWSEAAAPASSESMHLTSVGSVMGTLDYIAPEQARNAHAADIRADIYSLGCTLYYLLTGRPPFTADAVVDKLKAHTQEAAPALQSLQADVPPELAAVAHRMLAKDPAERFQTPAEVVSALAPFVGGGSVPRRPRREVPRWQLVAAAVLGVALFVGFAAAVVVATDRGRLQINPLVGDVQVVVSSRGEEVATIDTKTGSRVRWLPTGNYEVQLVGDDNAVKLDKTGFQMTRLGTVIVNTTWNTEGSGVIRSFGPTDETITRDGVAPDLGGWKITATTPRTVQMFEMRPPKLAKGPFFYRAQLKAENVTGRAYLEMWVRFPEQGEFFSKGFHNAVTGSSGWAEYEIPFFLQEGQQPDLIRLNLVIEGSGTVWIKNPQVLGRAVEAQKTTHAEPKSELTDAERAAADVRRGALAEVALVQQSFTTRGNQLPVVLFEQRGKTAFRFGRWLLIFEGVPCDGGNSGLLGLSAFAYPLQGGRGEGDLDFGAGIKDFGILIHEKWDGEVNEVSVNNFRFKLFDKGTRLQFGDQTFQATPLLQTIVIGRDGTARLEQQPSANE